MKCSFTKMAISEFAQQLTCQLGYLKKFFLCLCIVFEFNSSLAQNVGIGIDAPTQKLDVAGNIRGTNLFATSLVGIGTTTPTYKLHIIDGGIGITNTTDNVNWSFGYSSSTNGLNIIGNSSTRMTLLNTGNVGIGNTAPAYKLDVNGTFHAGSNAVIDGNVTANNAVIDGNVTVNNGKGIIQNVHGAGQLKYYTRTAAFGAVLSGFGLSAEGSFGFASAGFTSPPKVFVGDIVSTGGTVGELYRVQLIIYDCTTTSCKARLLNTSPNAVNYNITWNIVCIGE